MLQPKHRERLGLQGVVMNLNEQRLVMRGCKGCVGSHCNPHSNYFDLGCEEAIETGSLESACVCVCAEWQRTLPPKTFFCCSRGHGA